MKLESRPVLVFVFDSVEGTTLFKEVVNVPLLPHTFYDRASSSVDQLVLKEGFITVIGGYLYRVQPVPEGWLNEAPVLTPYCITVPKEILEP